MPRVDPAYLRQTSASSAVNLKPVSNSSRVAIITSIIQLYFLLAARMDCRKESDIFAHRVPRASGDKTALTD